MKIIAGLLIAILTVGLSSSRGQDAVSDLKTLDAKLTEAFRERDVQTLGKSMADEYILIDPRGAIHTKTKYLKHLADSTGKFKDWKETDVKVKVFGETAIVTGLLHVKGKLEEKELSVEYRWTRVYNKKGDEWRCVLEQHTHVHHMEAKKKD